jgi:hypothetical protein
MGTPQSAVTSNRTAGTGPGVRRLLVLLALAPILVAGCGGSSSKTLTREQFVAKANAICAQRNAAVRALPKSMRNLSDLKTLAAFLDRELAIDRPLIAKLKALKPPPADRAAWNQATADNDSALSGLTRAQAAAQAGNAAQIKRISAELQPINQKLKADATHFALTQCLVQPMPSG